MLTLFYNNEGYLYEAFINGEQIYTGISSDYNREKGYYDSPNFNAVGMAPKHINQYKGHHMTWNKKSVAIELDRDFHGAEEITKKYKHIVLVN